MRYSRALERELLTEIARSPEAHLVLGPRTTPVFGTGPYRRKDGAIVVYRDGASERLHRRLYRLVRFPGLGNTKLSPACLLWGCLNPWHYTDTGVTSATFCPNGHDLRATMLPDGVCGRCLTVRRAQRSNGQPTAAAKQRAKTHCPRGHAYDHHNTAVYRDPRGRIHRRCRACDATRRRRLPLSAPPPSV